MNSKRPGWVEDGQVCYDDCQGEVATRFTTETGKEAAVKRFHSGGDISSEMLSDSRDAQGIDYQQADSAIDARRRQ